MIKSTTYSKKVFSKTPANPTQTQIYNFLSVAVCTNADTRVWARRYGTVGSPVTHETNQQTKQATNNQASNQQTNKPSTQTTN